MSYKNYINYYNFIPTMKKQCKTCRKSIYVSSDWGTIRNKNHKIGCCSQICSIIYQYKYNEKTLQHLITTKRFYNLISPIPQ